jgi:hypothetical protein
MRFLKRIIYAGVLLGIIIGITLMIGGAFGNANPTCDDGRKNQGEARADCGGPCRPCGTANQIIIAERGVFPHQQINKTSFYIVFSNPSGDYWVKSFKYKLHVYDRYNTQIDSIGGTSSLPPAAITDKGLVPGTARAIVVAANIAPIDAARIDIEITDEDWKQVSTYIDPRLSVGGVKFTEDDGRVTVTGTVKNNSMEMAENASVGIVFRDGTGKAAGASMSALGNIPPFSAKSFEILWRSEGKFVLNAEKTEIFTEKKW